jgi:tetratricopeptide (TPR) repeat protein
MKKLAFLFLLISCTVLAYGQKSKVVSAHNYLKYDELDKAMMFIDEASEHPSTIGMAKTWYYKGLIYQKTFNHEKYGELVPNPLQIALKSYQKALEINPKYEFKEEIEQNIQKIAADLFQSGVDAYTASNFEKALLNFETYLSINPEDQSANLNAALSAQNIGNTEKAKSYYEKLIALKVDQPRPYQGLATIYKAEGDTAAALKVVKEGRVAFPADKKLMIEELNIYLAQGRTEEALEIANNAINNDPENATLHHVKASMLDNLGRKNEAIEAYKKALELNPESFDTNYNLGALYFNQGAEIINKANDIPPQKVKEYQTAVAAADDKFKTALPYLEKAQKIKPDDTGTLVSLKQIYLRLKDNENYERIDALMKDGE